MTHRLVIVRHTQTDDNVARRYSGQYDVELNLTGKKQAIDVSKRIVGLGNICAVASSNLSRAMFLGDRIGSRAGVVTRALPELREAGLGRLERLTRDEFPARYQGDMYRTSRPDFDFTEVGGESAQQVIERYLRGLHIMRRQLELHGPNGRLVVVGHGTALRLVFRDHFGAIDKLHEQGDFQELDWPL